MKDEIMLKKTGYRVSGEDASYTHKKCMECNNIIKRYLTLCESCQAKKAQERWEALPFQEWDEETPVYCELSDKYFYSPCDIEYFIDEFESEDVPEFRLVICEPINYKELDDSMILDQSCFEDEVKLPGSLMIKIKEFNEFLRTLPPIGWEPGKMKTEYKRDNR